MYPTLKLINAAHAMAGHASRGQAAVASNVAHLDTPNYRARIIPDFSLRPAGMQTRATRSGHFSDANAAPDAAFRLKDTGEKPNGNTVSLEDEIRQSALLRHNHELALSVYRSSLRMLRTSLGRA